MKNKEILIRCTEEEKRAMKKAAQKEQRSLSSYILWLFAFFCKKQNEEDGGRLHMERKEEKCQHIKKNTKNIIKKIKQKSTI